MNKTWPQSFVAIPINHPIGTFYLTAIPASVLLSVCFSSPHKRLDVGKDGVVDDVGHQRRLDPRRLHEISRYLETQDATLPGTVILAANSRPDGLSLDIEDEEQNWRWKVDKVMTIANDKVVKLVIPTSNKVAAVVDGQHRLMGFEDEHLSEEIREIYLPCAVFLDLPTAQQASIFATINFNQKPVNKSQTYELFGYNLEEEPEESWSPDKLAVNFSRRLNVDENSSLRGHIKVAAIDDSVLDSVTLAAKNEWTVSTATIVEGILSLITNDQKRDRDILNRYSVSERKRSVLKQVEYKGVRPPFLDLYISADRDIVIYKTVVNYFNAVHELFWSKKGNSVLHKTAGVQALFRVLKQLLPRQIETRKLTKDVWEELLSRSLKIDFSSQCFSDTSGRGRSRIQDAFLVSLGLKTISEIRDATFQKCLVDMMDRRVPNA